MAIGGRLSPFMTNPYEPTFVDLFAGCGGFTLGLQRAGFRCLAAVDFDPQAAATLKANLPTVDHVLQRDLTQLDPKELSRVIERSHVDVIVGGPPCQGFSTARQVDGSNHGQSRLKADKRRLLYRDFLRFVEFFLPRVFVIENVLGIRSAIGGEYFTRVQHEARSVGTKRGHFGYRVHTQIEDAQSLGVPQKRRRQLIIGVRADVGSFLLPSLACSPRSRPEITLGMAIGDLPVLRAGRGEHQGSYDLEKRKKHLSREGAAAKAYLYDALEVHRASHLTGHVARPHSERDLRDFKKLREGESSAVAMRVRGQEFEFPYDKSSFKDRYTRQSRWKPCSTIVAHLSKDGLMFIHPTQNRSLTPREAARVQSFPDWFQFPQARTHAFRLIGNAVPPLVAESIGRATLQILGRKFSSIEGPGDSRSQRANKRASSARDAGNAFHDLNGAKEALREVERLKELSSRELRKLEKDEFLRGWNAIFVVFPNLHPANARDHGRATRHFAPLNPALGPKIRFKSYVRSGWPIDLERVGEEAWRRHSIGDLGDSELFLFPEYAA